MKLEEIDPAARGSARRRGDVLVSYAQSYHLSSRQLPSNAFLFWAEPDQHEVALAVARGEGFGAEQEETSTTSTISELLKFLRPAQAANNAPEAVEGAGPTKDRQTPKQEIQEFELSQLPIDLQQKVVAMFLSNSRNSAQRNYSELWLRPEVWPKASIVYLPEDPKRPGTYRTLLVNYVLNTPQGRFRVAVDTFEGGTSAIPVGGTATPTIVPEGDLQVLSTAETGEDAKPITVRDILHPKGTALKTVQNITPIGWQKPEEMAAKVSLDATRRPLGEFLAQVSDVTKTTLRLAEDKEGNQLLISAHLEHMTLPDLMDSLSRLYGRTWKKNDDNSFVLTGSTYTKHQMNLLQLGFFPWYKFREVNTSARSQYQQDFYQFAAQVVDQAGQDVLTPAGVPVASLAPELQKELKERVERVMSRQILMEQSSRRDLFNGKWSFTLASSRDSEDKVVARGAQLTLIVDGKRQSMIRVPMLASRNDGRG